MSPILIILCAVASLGALAVVGIDLLYGHDRRIRRRLETARRNAGVPLGGKSSLFREWDLTQVDADRLLGRCRLFIEQSGLPLTLEQLATASLAAAIGLGGIAYLSSNSVPVSIGLAVLGAGAPTWYVISRRRRRTDAFSSQLPEVFDVMSRAVSAGQTVASALQLVASECRPPISKEFALCCEQQNLGLPHETTLRDLARRIPVPELHIFVIALLVQRQCGGSPVELLNNISDIIRKRMKLTQRVHALTGEGRMQAIVLTVLPLAAFGWLWLSQPDYINALIVRPWLLSGVAALQVIGTLWIRRTVQIEY
jgi:tight adherence protein B